MTGDAEAPVTTAMLLERWRAACASAPRPVDPPQDADRLAGALLAAVAAGADWTPSLEDTARRWAASGVAVEALVAQLAALRQVLRAGGRCRRSWAVAADSTVDRLMVAVTEAALDDATDRARTDPLTGIGNRRALLDAAPAVLAASLRASQPLAVVMVDVDGLKLRNDTGGHQAGDRALVRLAEAWQQVVRASDQVFRIGGDEFVAVLPQTGAADVADVVARVGAHDVPRFTWGSAVAPQDGTSLGQLLDVADQRLYAQRAGDTTRPDAPAPSLPLAGRAGTGSPSSTALRRPRRWARQRAAGQDRPSRQPGGRPLGRPAPPG